MIPRRQNDWEHGPVYYRRRFRFIVAMLGVVGLVGVLLSQSTHLVGPSYRWWMPAASFVSMVVGMVAIALAISRFRRRIRREFEAAEGRLCTHCGYNLRDLPPRGGCPECGHEFDAEFDARTWAGAGFVVPRPLEPPSPDA